MAGKSRGKSWNLSRDVAIKCIDINERAYWKSTLKVFSTYEEKGNLFTVVIAPSGAGKTPACHLGCIDPIMEH